jgi:hypothetical protein
MSQTFTAADVAALDREAFHNPRPDLVGHIALSAEASELLSEYEDALQTVRLAQGFLFLALSGAKNAEEVVQLVSRAWVLLSKVGK